MKRAIALILAFTLLFVTAVKVFAVDDPRPEGIIIKTEKL
jgi:hypothetical protein